MEIYLSCSHLRQDSYASPLLKTCHLSNRNALLFSSVSPCIPCKEASFEFHLRNSQGCEPTGKWNIFDKLRRDYCFRCHGNTKFKSLRLWDLVPYVISECDLWPWLHPFPHLCYDQLAWEATALHIGVKILSTSDSSTIWCSLLFCPNALKSNVKSKDAK